MAGELTFLSSEDVLELHELTMARHGGLAGLRDPAQFEAALAMPMQQFAGKYLHVGIPAMAAAYLFHISQSHPFHDGNKRTAALAALAFLKVNGVTARLPAMELERLTLGVAAGAVSKDGLTAWLAAALRTG